MRIKTIAFAGPILVALAGFSASSAQSSQVSEKTFDWIFFAIIGIPFIIALTSLFWPNMLERFVSEWPWEKRRASWELQDRIAKRPD
jgi:hypothetical protein